MNRLIWALLFLPCLAIAMEAPEDFSTVEINSEKTPILYFRWKSPTQADKFYCVKVDAAGLGKIPADTTWRNAKSVILLNSGKLDPLTDEEKTRCFAGLPQFVWRVAKNKTYPTRPLYDGALFESGTTKAIGRVEVDRACEGKIIKPVGTSQTNAYQYTTNKDNLRGVSVCVLVELSP